MATVKLVGGAPNQVPRNKDLGDLASMNSDAFAIKPQASVTQNGIG